VNGLNLTILALIWFSVYCVPIAMAQGGEEVFGCEANPTGNPIGGGEGYSDIKTTGDFIVKTKEELLQALKDAKPGQVIFIPDGVEIDLAGQQGIGLPAGVTLAGTRGLNGSAGARIFTTWRQSHTLMKTTGDSVRLTGLRFEGPEGGTEKTADYFAFLSIGHYGAEVDNCEVSRFNLSGISIGSASIDVRVHHNYIHHCQRSGYGYGVVVGEGGVHVIANKFDYCRHHIAAGGQPGCNYEAAWNLVMPNCTSYCFDVHGGGDRGDNTDIGGDWILIHHNTFQGPQRAVGLYGVPSQRGEIHHNWFAQELEKAVLALGNTRVYDNACGPDRTPQGKPMEFVDHKLVEL